MAERSRPKVTATKPTRLLLAVSISPQARQLIDLAARSEGIKLSTFVRHSAVVAARRRLLEEGQYAIG